MRIAQECHVLFRTNPGNSTSQKQQLFDHLPPISQTIQVRRTRFTRHCCRGKNVLISDVLPWTPIHGRANVGGSARTYWSDTRCRLLDLLGAIDNREGWWNRIREIRSVSVIWWWWWWWCINCCKNCVIFTENVKSSMTLFFEMSARSVSVSCLIPIIDVLCEKQGFRKYMSYGLLLALLNMKR